MTLAVWELLVDAGVVGSVLDEASFDSSLIFLIELLHQEQT